MARPADIEDRQNAEIWAKEHGKEFYLSIYPDGIPAYPGFRSGAGCYKKLEYRWWCRKQRLEGVVGTLLTENEAVSRGECARDDVCLSDFGIFI